MAQPPNVEGPNLGAGLGGPAIPQPQAEQIANIAQPIAPQIPAQVGVQVVAGVAQPQPVQPMNAVAPPVMAMPQQFDMQQMFAQMGAMMQRPVNAPVLARDPVAAPAVLGARTENNMRVRPSAGTISIGVGDNTQFIQQALQTSHLYDLPIAYALNHGIFTNDFDDETMSTHLYIMSYGRYLKNGTPINTTMIYVNMLGELFGWMTPPDNQGVRMTEIAARDRYINAYIALCGARSVPPMIRERLGVQQAATEEPDVTIYAEIRTFLDPDDEVHIVRPVRVTFEWCYLKMQDLVANVAQTRAITNTWSAIHAIIGFTKRGTVSPRNAEKITRACLLELNFDADLDTEVMATFYHAYGRALDAVTAEQTVLRWTAAIPAHAVRLHTNLQQTANSGLTAIVTIGQAFRKHPTFSWWKVCIWFSGEVQSAVASLRAINNNPYYGFNQGTANQATSRRFKNLSYWCKELLVKADGENALNNYGGWTRSPTHSIGMNKLIDTYIANIDAGLDREPTPAELAVVNVMLAAINDNNAVIN